MGITDAHGRLPGFRVNSIEHYLSCSVCSRALAVSGSHSCRLCKLSVHPFCADSDGFCFDCAQRKGQPAWEFFHDETMGEISGFGGRFEVDCQRMLNAGVHWLNANEGKRAILSAKSRLFDTWRSVPQALELKAVMESAVENPNPSMVEAVILRLAWIAGHGWNAYRNSFLKLKFRWPTVAEKRARHADR